MLGVRQRESLDEYAAILKRNPPGAVRIEVKILPFRRYTREQGSGRGFPITVTVFECYEGAPDARLTGTWLASCQWDYDAVKKGQEIARYLVAAGCPKERIRLRQKK